MVEKITNLPIAENFMQTARSFGNYDLALALADIIDNSITAGAENIYIDASFDDDEIRIRDDGCGMSREDLITAMRIGSKNPQNERDKNDLGRFGIGLKTASFSQADKLTVLTNENGVLCGAEWDLNDCADFKMTLYNGDETLDLLNSSVCIQNGTEVIWRELTRLKRGSKFGEEHDDFNRAVNNAIDEIGLIFHRFLSEDGTKKETKTIQIFFNNDLVKPIDPFCQSNSKTQRLSKISESVGKESITFTPFTLPSFSELKSREKEQLGGKDGFVKNSGFYIYRNERLIRWGTWFKLIPFGELSKLSRIMVDIPNSLDGEWKITVDKSGMQLPGILRKRLSSWLQNRVVPSSHRVFKSKGEKENSYEPLWIYLTQKGVARFSISQTHPIMKNFSEKLENPHEREFKKILRVIEAYLPIENIRNVVSDKPETIHQGYSDTAPPYILEMAGEIAHTMLNNGKTKSEILSSLSKIQPFDQFHDNVEKHLDKRKIFKA